MSSILVIESNKELRENMILAFSFEGCQVIEADSSQSGVMLAREYQPEVILCEMPYRIDYYAFLRTWSTFQQDRPARLYFLTTENEATFPLTQMLPPLTRVITKPFNVNKLLQICKRDFTSEYMVV